ncbi:hypothetical protein EJ997_01565 [Flaviflexus ciconiae]|uniref:Cell division protein FtsL n=1 Tax=Flaviflexus ciconiae TaxID=2496867 RepID=A0A3Q9G2R4_9ACTO|nr:hypothetical protein [Flaviflexus ciconiae]AZQ76214.1 hypothetical protein EJ997_01565 [Flaviflexus ciconiae]
MSATATATAPARPARRPVVTGLPSIQVVPSPAPIRGFIAATIACILLFCGALATVFYLNTSMVEGAYQIQEQQVLLNDLADTRNTLQDEISEASTAVALRDRAEEMGLVPATEIRHVDLGAGVVTGGSDDNAQ